MLTLPSIIGYFATKACRKVPKCLTPYYNVPTFSQASSRTYAGKNDVTSKEVLVQGAENKGQLRVRRARPADVPRLLRFVRENARDTWPGLVPPPSASHLVLCDYVARALAQGHSLLAEQHEPRQGWSQIRGLALGMATCPWDATILEKWAQCVKCSRSKKLMYFTAHCLQAPALHEKYRVNKIMQVVLIVPRKSPGKGEIINVLAKNAIQRGADLGFPLLRFDVNDDNIATVLEKLQLKKELQLRYDHDHALDDDNLKKPINDQTSRDKAEIENNFITVYTTIPGK